MKYFLLSPITNFASIQFDLMRVIYNQTKDANLCTNFFIADPDVTVKKMCTNTATFVVGDLLPSDLKTVSDYRKLCVLKIHPDLLFLLNQYDAISVNLGTWVYLNLKNYAYDYIDLQTRENTLSLNFDNVQHIISPTIHLKSDFLRYQDNLKHLLIENTSNNKVNYLTIGGKRTFDAYEILGYEPMSWERLLEWENDFINDLH